MSTPPAETQIAIEEIIEQTARFFGVAELDVHSPTRMRRPTEARHVAMYLARELTEHSFPEIGDAIGQRDHSTVIRAAESIQNRIDTEPDFAERVRALLDQLAPQPRRYAIAQAVEEYTTVYVIAHSPEEALELYNEGTHSSPINKRWDNERVVGEPELVE